MSFLIILAPIILVAIGVLVYMALNSYRIEELNTVDTPPVNEQIAEYAHTLGEEKNAWRYRRIDAYPLIASLRGSLSRANKIFRAIESPMRVQLPASEWLIDNYYLLSEALSEAGDSFSRDVFRFIPSDNGLPRIKKVAAALVYYYDGALTPNHIKAFLEEYQTKQRLNSKELWLFPMMLKLVLIEYAARAVRDVMDEYEQLIKAEKYFNAFLRAANDSERVSVYNNLRGEGKKIGPAFISYFDMLIQRSEEGVRGSFIRWFEAYLEKRGVTAENMRYEAQLSSSKNRILVSNVIGSIKMLSNLRWEYMYEDLSEPDRLYRSEKSGVYSRMDEESRKFYRERTWRIAYQFDLDEEDVAKVALDKANESDDALRGHVGYYLNDDGLDELYAALGLRPPKKHDYSAWYITSIIVLALLQTGLFTWGFSYFGLWAGIGAFFLTLMPCMEIAVILVNRVSARMFAPAFVPKIKIERELDEDNQAAVVIPVLLTSPESAAELVGQMEVYYMANPIKGLRFVLLGDYKDSDREKEDGDEEITAAALEAVRQLNEKYNGIFYYIHRKRVLNAADGRYQGRERKRGALMAFNALLLGADNGEYEVLYGDIDALRRSKYAITLDADTALVRQAAAKLIGAAMHPLNKPYIEDGRLARGYTILQPAIGVSATAAARTLFSLYYSGQSGIDSYTFAASDVYMDMANEASFCGKGIYHIEAFDTIMKHKLPSNTVLSHDLLEGSFVGTALVSDVRLFDGYPKSYMSYSKRLNRWVRGDWQLLPYLFRKIKTETGARIPNPLSVLAKWKIFDNMRRSVLPFDLVALLILGTLLMPLPLVWVALLLFVSFLPLILDALTRLRECMKLRGIKLRDAFKQLKNVALRFFFNFAFLPFEAYNQLDASCRSLWRLAVSHVNLLQWTTAADIDESGGGAGSYLRYMSPVMLISVTFMLLAVVINPGNAPFAFPITLLWLFSPFLAFYLNRSARRREAVISTEDSRNMGMLMRTTWNYFEDFCTNKYNYMPPDNYQVKPSKGVADRSSPTNMGLGMTAVLAAFDRGYLSNKRMLERLAAMTKTLERMDKWNGHLYNWYELSSLKVLRPHYVSVVDSGNFAAYLLVCAAGIRGAQNEPIINKAKLLGLGDTLRLCQYDATEMDAQIRAELARVTDKADKLCAGCSAEEQYDFYFELKDAVDPIDTDSTRRLKAQIGDYINEIDSTLHWIKLFDDENAPEEANALKERLYALDAPASYTDAYEALKEEIAEKAAAEENGQWYGALAEALELTYTAMTKRVNEAEHLVAYYIQLVDNMDFTAVYNSDKELFYIGIDTEKNIPDDAYYDLLASEARTASFIAIAKGDVPQKHWFNLSRTLIEFEGQKALVSWGGTMFEYLMPLLIMPTYDYTLMDETYETIVKAQRLSGERNKLPWGVSECAFYSFDTAMFYQYKAFGIQEIGLKRGLNEDYIVAPYASALALAVAPNEAIKNIYALADEGAMGAYGLYEAVDYTRSRIGKEKRAVVYTYMAHHQGMIIMALANLLNDGVMSKRLFSYPMIKATELLLQEKCRYAGILQDSDLNRQRNANEKISADTAVHAHRFFTACDQAHPVTQIFSNGSVNLVCTLAGASYIKWNGLLVDKWSADPITEEGGEYIFIRNTATDQLWDGYMRHAAPPFKVRFDEDKAEYERVDGAVKTAVRLCVSPENDAVIREIALTNNGESDIDIELAGLHDLCMACQSAYRSHPAFSNLFIKTDYLEHEKCLTAVRRPRHDDEHIAVGYMLITDEIQSYEIEYDTDSAGFIGRSGTPSAPDSIIERRALNKTVGYVINPVLALRKRLFVPSLSTVKAYFVTLMASDTDELAHLINKYNNTAAAERAFEMASTHSAVQLRAQGISSEMAILYQSLSSRLIFVNPFTRDNDELLRIRGGASLLWSKGINGEIPIIAVFMDKASDLYNAGVMLKAHEYFFTKRLECDLVFVCSGGGYMDTVEGQIRDMIEVSHARNMMNMCGGVYIINHAHMSNEAIVYLKNTAAICIDAKQVLNGQLTVNYDEYNDQEIRLGELHTDPDMPFVEYETEYDNGLGGFVDDGREYHIRLGDGVIPPAPWSNILTNKNFGCVITDGGGGYMWAGNSREFKLTPWLNGGLYTETGECVYIRDEDNGYYCTATASPVRRAGKYLVKHGQGYTHYLYNTGGLELRQSVFVDDELPVKYTRVNIENTSDSARNLSLTYYIKPLLSNGIHSRLSVLAAKDEGDYVYVRNCSASDDELDSGLFWASAFEKIDRTVLNDNAFIGRNHTLSSPRAMHYETVGHNGARGQICLALRINISVEPHTVKDTTFFCGYADDPEKARDCIDRIKESSIEDIYRRIKNKFEDSLARISVNTPNKSFNIMMNRWLPYQSLNSRFYARASYYQSGGAIGFRDQLQDCVCLLYRDKALVRAHILKCAAHQFIEGDVLHWWHEPNRGVRTKITDDLLFLPYVTALYVRDTGDPSILDEIAPYLDGEELKDDQTDRYDYFVLSNKKESLKQHCLRAIKRAYRLGAHDLPLMGTGDWNDAMNNVGRDGRGESVWLAFFMISAIDLFGRYCLEDGEGDEIYAYREQLRQAVNDNAWDGDWFIRAYCDDGLPIGSRRSEECHIDIISQSWCALAEAADYDRIRMALDAVNNNLIDYQLGIVRLLTPPFSDRCDIGYISKYPPGVRENGGQYTHAAAWYIMALAKSGLGSKAEEIFNMINPINHTRTPIEVNIYQKEPYVLCADVYSQGFTKGRGGWSWYTGASAWLYRAGLESILGLNFRGDELYIEPCIPDHWESYSVEYLYKSTVYTIAVHNPDHIQKGVKGLLVDGHTADYVKLTDDGQTHKVKVIMG